MQCDQETICKTLECHTQDILALQDEVFGSNKSVFIATGNLGVPTNDDITTSPTRYANDTREYSAGAAIINSFNPDGLIITGDANYDRILNSGGAYPDYQTEQKITNGFTDLLLKKRIFPTMGDLDYWVAQDTPGSIDYKMARTYLKLFPYLSDAKRYHSVYDQKSNTEFFFLSSGRYLNYYVGTTGFIYPLDIQVMEDQYDWLVQKCASTPARNRVVIFHHPFTGISDAFKQTGGQGAANVYNDFATWDFEAMGIKLIINGHSGNSFHLRRGATDIVNASAFVRSRMSQTTVANNNEPPSIPVLYGKQGYSIEYFSHQPMGVAQTNVYLPAGVDSYIIPKNEILKLTCDTGGIKCEFISYDPYSIDYQQLLSSMKVEHTFEVSSLD